MPYKSDQAKKDYQRNFHEQRKQSHRAVKVTMELARYHLIQQQAEVEGKSVAKTLELLAVAKVLEAPFVSEEQKLLLDEIIGILRSCGTGIHQLSQRASETENVEELMQSMYTILAQIEELVRKKIEC